MRWCGQACATRSGSAARRAARRSGGESWCTSAASCAHWSRAAWLKASRTHFPTSNAAMLATLSILCTLLAATGAVHLRMAPRPGLPMPRRASRAARLSVPCSGVPRCGCIHRHRPRGRVTTRTRWHHTALQAAHRCTMQYSVHRSLSLCLALASRRDGVQLYTALPYRFILCVGRG